LIHKELASEPAFRIFKFREKFRSMRPSAKIAGVVESDYGPHSASSYINNILLLIYMCTSNVEFMHSELAHVSTSCHSATKSSHRSRPIKMRCSPIAARLGRRHAPRNRALYALWIGRVHNGGAKTLAVHAQTRVCCDLGARIALIWNEGCRSNSATGKQRARSDLAQYRQEA
jgi:hypothetical protein